MYHLSIKERVIVGRLIPAGTNLPAYRTLDIVLEDELDARASHDRREHRASASSSSG